LLEEDFEKPGILFKPRIFSGLSEFETEVPTDRDEDFECSLNLSGKDLTKEQFCKVPWNYIKFITSIHIRADV